MTEEQIRRIANRDDSCEQCAFYPGGNLCYAPWSDGQIEDEDIPVCYEGVYRYLTGKPAAYLAQREAQLGPGWLREKEKSEPRKEVEKACPLRSIASAAAGGGHTLAGCLGEKCAFYGAARCAMAEIAASLENLAAR